MVKKFVGVKIENELYKQLQEFKRQKKFESDSAAVREIVRYYLLDIWPKQRAESDAKVIEKVTMDQS